MKSIKQTALALLGAGVLLMAFQCGKDEGEPVVNTYNVHHSECLLHTDAAAKGFESPDSVSIAHDAGTTVHITHHNLMVNCGTAETDGGINVTCVRNGSTIDIYETEDENNPQADCMCEVDNEFDIYGVEHGTFTFVFHSWYPEAQSFTVTF